LLQLAQKITTQLFEDQINVEKMALVENGGTNE
jgi:hypothetical protein